MYKLAVLGANEQLQINIKLIELIFVCFYLLDPIKKGHDASISNNRKHASNG